jgi:hypothetical protein
MWGNFLLPKELSASQEVLCVTELLMLLFKVTSSKFSAADSKSSVKEIPYYVNPKFHRRL